MILPPLFFLAFIAGALQEAGELAQRVIGISAFGGLAVFGAHLAGDVAVLVVAERDFACAAGGLFKQVSNAVIAVCRCQGARRGSDYHSGSSYPINCVSVKELSKAPSPTYTTLEGTITVCN